MNKKKLILYTMHRHNTHETPIFARSFVFVFNSTKDSLCLIDWDKLFQSRHVLNTTEFMPQEVDFAAGNVSKGPFLILHVMYLKTKYDHINLGFRLFKDWKTSHIKARK